MSAQTAFPRFEDSPANWTGPELAATPERWVHELTAAELDDLDALIERHGSRTDDLTALTPEDAALPVLVENAKGYGIGGVDLAAGGVVRRMSVFQVVGGECP